MYFKLLKYCDCLSVIHYYCNLLFAAYFEWLQIISKPLQQGSKLQFRYTDSFLWKPYLPVVDWWNRVLLVLFVGKISFLCLQKKCHTCCWAFGSGAVTIFSSPELKAQVSFHGRLSSVRLSVYSSHFHLPLQYH